MIVLLPALAVAVAALAALALGLRSLVSTALAGYLALVTQVALATWVLSPFHAVTRTGLLAAELVLLAVAASAWWRRGRPAPDLSGAPSAVRELLRDPVTALFLALLAGVLGYELVVGLGAAPNNYDSLTYHLSRAAAWKQHGGIQWIANAPTGRINEFQPLAEQGILFGFVAAGRGALYALPQLVAEVATLGAVYGTSRRLGFDRRASACGAALLATFSAFALQSTTAQNDIVAASFPIVAAYFLLAGASLDLVLAGVAVALGAGAKLTTALAWPLLAWLAWPAGREGAKRILVGVGIGVVLAAGWGFVLNLIHTGHLLGHGQGRTDQTVSPSFVTDVHTAARLLYRTLDLGLFSNVKVWSFAAVGVVAGAAIAFLARRRVGARERAVLATVVALPLLAPLLVLALAPVLAWITRQLGIAVHDPIYGFSLNRAANEDSSAFGAVGAYALIAAPIAAIAVARSDRRQLALAFTMPVYVILLGLYAGYNIWLTRFLVVPVALTAPLFARLLRGRLATAAVLAVAGTTVFYTLAYDNSKPGLGNAIVAPWHLDQAVALEESPAQPQGRRAAAAVIAYDRLVPDRACVGAVLDPDEWSYPLWGPKLRHRLYFLPSLQALVTAEQDNLKYVIVSTGANAPIAGQFTAAGWKTQPLGGYWTLAIAPHVAHACGVAG